MNIVAIYNSVEYLFANFVIVIILFLTGLILGRLSGKFISKILHELELDSIVKKTTKKSISLEFYISTLLSWSIYVLFTTLALEQLDVINPLLIWVASAFILLIFLSILLAVRDFLPNFFAGIIIQRKCLFKVGDVIEVGDLVGVVVSMGLVEIELEKEGDRIFIPNSLINKKKFSVKS